jgi:hypothetical protein
VSPRRAKRRVDEATPLRTPPGAVEEHPDGEWMVRRVTGSSAGKSYRCPGCDQEIRPVIPHVVAWPVGAEDDRRHWHTPCWSARDRRGAKVLRAKNAPRHG